MTNTIKPMQWANGDFVDHGDYVVIKAEPGFFAIDRYGHGEKVEFAKLIVVGWLVEVCDFSKDEEPIVLTKPICLEPLTCLFKGEILQPDGRVSMPGGGWHDSFEEFERYERERIKDKNVTTLGFEAREAKYAASV